MRAGRLYQRITFQRRDGTKDAFGTEDQNTWADLVTVWGACEPIAGREFFAAQQVNSEITARITIRYSSDVSVVTTKDRASCLGKLYDIRNIIDPNLRHKELQLMCADHDASAQ